MLLTDLSTDYVRSHFSDADDASWRVVLRLFAEMEAEGAAWLKREGVPPADRRFHRVLDARYRGQNFEVKLDCAGLGDADLAEMARRFHAAHTREYGYAIPNRGIELVSARVQAIGRVRQAPHARITGGASLSGAMAGRRPVFMGPGAGWQDTAIYVREALPLGVPIPGPAIVNEMSATTLVRAGQQAVVDPFGNIIIGASA
jgi:N-methylhydantoinase A